MTRRTLRVLHFFPSFAYGGQQRRLASLIRGLGPQFEHRIFALDADISAASLAEGEAASVIAYPMAKSRLVSFSNVAKLRRDIAAAAADLLCTYNFGSIEAVIANKIGSNLPHLHHEDGFGPEEADGRQKKTRVMARRQLLRGSLVATPSTVLERIAIDSWGLDPARVRRIGVGVQIAKYAARRHPVRTEDEIVVGSLGALRAEKNFLRLIRCFKEAAHGAPARLVIHGEGPDRAMLEAAAAGDNRISLPGATAAPEIALAEMDIFALSSDTEQTPTSLMEAMATGLPALATEVGDVRMMMGEAGRDYVTPPSDEAQYIRRLATLIRDPAERRRLAEANAARATSFDEITMIDAFRALYLEVAGGGARK